MIPVYVVVRDLVDAPKKLVGQINELRDGMAIVVDCASTNPKCIEWMNSLSSPVYHTENFGVHAPWDAGLILEKMHHTKRFASSYYVVTDGDLDIETVPKDVLFRMRSILNERDDIQKIGLSIEINDLPDNDRKESILSFEQKYWKVKDDSGWKADCDSAFCMYRAGDRWTGYQCIRMDRPYTARHVPWYWDENNLPADAQWYVKHADPRFSTWGVKLKRSQEGKNAITEDGLPVSDVSSVEAVGELNGLLPGAGLSSSETDTAGL